MASHFGQQFPVMLIGSNPIGHELQTCLKQDAWPAEVQLHVVQSPSFHSSPTCRPKPGFYLIYSSASTKYWRILGSVLWKTPHLVKFPISILAVHERAALATDPVVTVIIDQLISLLTMKITVLVASD